MSEVATMTFAEPLEEFRWRVSHKSLMRHYRTVRGMNRDNKKKVDALVINEVQLLLAEKRTSLAVLRTGIAVLALPMSVASFLIVTSRYYDVFQVLYVFVPLVVISVVLVGLGMYLIARAVVRMRRYDRLIEEVKRTYRDIERFIPW